MREQEDTMAEAHDSWLSGLGIDVDKILKSLGPPVPAVPEPFPLGVIDQDEVQELAWTGIPSCNVRQLA